ncbi:MAG: hypothetical protein KDI44_08680 [Thiothrix sp.]|nr:hypothetical protein [Thiothrix sp.]HPQ97079.1 hypothetical protein [Thiolinea sp.]
MKSRWLLALSLMFISGAAAAQQWEAKCTDGKNLHYLQNINGDGYLYLTVELPDKTKRVFPYARIKQTMFNGQAVCGQIFNGLQTRTNQPVTQFCANKQLKIIYLKYQDPMESQPMQGGKFCDATVIER